MLKCVPDCWGCEGQSWSATTNRPWEPNSQTSPQPCHTESIPKARLIYCWYCKKKIVCKVHPAGPVCLSMWHTDASVRWRYGRLWTTILTSREGFGYVNNNRPTLERLITTHKQSIFKVHAETSLQCFHNTSVVSFSFFAPHKGMHGEEEIRQY